MPCNIDKEMKLHITVSLKACWLEILPPSVQKAGKREGMRDPGEPKGEKNSVGESLFLLTKEQKAVVLGRVLGCGLGVQCDFIPGKLSIGKLLFSFFFLLWLGRFYLKVSG